MFSDAICRAKQLNSNTQNLIFSMNWLIKTLTSTLGRKLIMALTGLFLCTFLVVHLLGNLQMLKGDEGEAFNKYAYFMGHSPLIQTVAIGNYVFILLHIFTSIALTQINKQARPQRYAYSGDSNNSHWTSRNMGILGSIIFIFLVIHLKNFWYEMKFGDVEMVTYGSETVKDLYKVVENAFQNPLYVGFYVISMVMVAFHLYHGFASAFQTLGLNHPKYTPIIKALGYGFAILIPLGFALIPILMFIA